MMHVLFKEVIDYGGTQTCESGSAWYLSAAEIINPAFGREVLPIGAGDDISRQIDFTPDKGVNMITVEDLLFKGSPFLPEVEQDVVDRILADIGQKPLCLPAELIAIRLCQVMEERVPMILAEGHIVTLHKRFGTTFTDIGSYLLGSTRPFLLLRSAITGALEGFSHVRNSLYSADLNSETRAFLLDNLEYAVGLLRQDPSGRTLVNSVVAQETKSGRDVYYQAGLEAARRLFTSYSDLIDDILRQTGYRAPLLPPQKP